jgi:hypothetical protein
VSAPVDLDRYCARCDSEVGWRDDRPDFCAVCWDDRLPLRLRIRRLIEEAERGRRLSNGARAAVVDELGKLCDRLYDTARNLDRHLRGPERAAQLREAADYLSDVRRAQQR